MTESSAGGFESEELLAHLGWVSCLARSLVRDTHAAEDLAQDVLLTTMQQPPGRIPGGRQLRAWLTSVLRRQSVSRHRSQTSRTAREEAVSTPEGTASTLEIVARTELQQRVARVVLGLAEPYRSTLLYRYVDDLSGPLIAERTGVSEELVRKRLSRGREMLRRELSKELGAEGKDWIVALAPILPGKDAITGAGGASMATLLGGLIVGAQAKIVVGLAVAAGAFLLVEWIRGPHAEDRAELAEQAAATSVLVPAVAPVGAVRAAEAPELPAAERRAVQPARGDSAANRGPMITGRVVHEDESPASGARVVLVEMRPAPEHARRLEDTADAEGGFSLPLQGDPGSRYRLSVSQGGFVTLSWMWSLPDPPDGKDLGTVVLERGGAIRGRIVDREGEPLHVEGWTVRVGEFRQDGERVSWSGSAEVDPSTGTFLVRDVPRGPRKVAARAQGSLPGTITSPEVQVLAGETVETELVYDGPELGRTIRVEISSRFLHLSDVPAPLVRLEGAGERAREARPGEWDDGVVFEDLGPGVYTLSIDDPRFERWVRDGVRPGDRVEADVVASSSLQLEVRDRETGEPVAGFTVGVTYRRVREDAENGRSVHTSSFGVSDPGKEGLLVDLLDGDYVLDVSAAGYPERRVEVANLRVGETRTVEVQLGSSALVAGRVVRPDGRPAARVAVRLIRREVPPGFPAQPDFSFRPFLRPGTARTTDEQGSFRLDASGAGEYLVQASGAEGNCVYSERIDLAESEVREDIVLTLGEDAFLEGRLTGLSGGPTDSMRVIAVPADGGLSRYLYGFENSMDAYATLGSEGRFRLGPLPPGPTRVFALLPERVARGFGTDGDRPRGSLELESVDLPAGGVLRHEFSLGDLSPGTVTVEVLDGGRPAGNVIVALASEIYGPLSAQTDSSGVTPPLPAWPGEWRVEVQGKDGWKQPPKTVLVGRGEATRVNIEFDTVAGELQLVDAKSGEPLARASLWLYSMDGEEPRQLFHSHATDSFGRLALELPTGEYLVRAMVGPEVDLSREARFTWTDDGPEPARVSL